MDFAVCPSCHQSVIEDDAVDCPFCGAPMKGGAGAKPSAGSAKPAATPAKPAAAAPSTPAAKRSGTMGKVGAKPTLPGDDLPFESELTTGKAAILAMPNPSKQR